MDKERPWYHAAFGDSYSRIYAHRDDQLAEREIDFLLGCVQPHLDEVAGPFLDLACGAGRHLRALERQSRPVVGLDLSASLLREAHAARPGAALLRADMRALPLASQHFAGIFQLFTAFGYFHDAEEDLMVLHEVSRLLKPRGFHVLDFLDADVVRRDLVPESQRTVEDWTVFERRWIADDRVHKEVRVDDTHGMTVHRHQESIRLYSAEELIALLQRAGLHLEESYGSYRGDALGAGDRCLLITTRHA